MNKLTLFSLLSSSMLIAVSCGNRTAPADTSTFGALPIVAEKTVTANGDTVIVASLDKAGDPVSIKASELMDGLELIKLDNAEEAIVGEGMIWVNDNRIFIYSNHVVKQFDRSGKYLGTVGGQGNGPGEYAIAPYDIYTDEAAGRIYIIPYMAEKVMAYDINGNFIENIPLAQKLDKGRINVDTEDKRISVVSLTFNVAEKPMVTWVQDFEGNVISSDLRPDLTVVPDYSSEVYSDISTNREGFTYALFNIVPCADSLYTCIDGRLIPAFTAKLPAEVPPHTYSSTPSLFGFIMYGDPIMMDENTYTLPAQKQFVVDRETLRGGYVDLLLDNIGPIAVDSGWMNGTEYFAVSYDPGTLIDLIEEAPDSHPQFSDEEIAKMKEFGKSISADDNNYVVVGKWKKP